MSTRKFVLTLEVLRRYFLFSFRLRTEVFPTTKTYPTTRVFFPSEKGEVRPTPPSQGISVQVSHVTFLSYSHSVFVPSLVFTSSTTVPVILTSIDRRTGTDPQCFYFSGQPSLVRGFRSHPVPSKTKVFINSQGPSQRGTKYLHCLFYDPIVSVGQDPLVSMSF